MEIEISYYTHVGNQNMRNYHCNPSLLYGPWDTQGRKDTPDL